MKVLAVASGGGHWIELLRLLPAFEQEEVIFASTKKCYEETVEGFQFYTIPDTNRNKKFFTVYAFFKILNVVKTVKPNVIISTGALPGLITLFIGKIYGMKTIWIDSIANVDELSFSGKIASKFADRTYTQWPDLASKKCLFHGNILS